MKTTIQVRADEKFRRQLQKLADKESRTLSNMVRVLVEEALEYRQTSDSKAAD